MKRLLILASLLLATPALAVDDYAATQGAGKTFRCVDVAGICYPVFAPANTAGAVWVYGNGVTGTASPRVTIASDNSALAVTGASGAFSSGSIASGAIASGAISAGAQVDLLTMRGTKAPGTAAANSALVGGLYDAAAIALTDGQQAALQTDSVGNLKTANGITSTTLSGWTSATGLNATQTLMVNHGAPALLVQLNQTSTISAGATTIEGTYDGSNWVSVPVAQILNPNTLASLTNPYTLVASTNQPFLVLTQGYQSIRLKLSTQITGSATVTPFVTLLNYNPAIGALLNPLSAGSAIIGKVGIDQTTPNTTNHVSSNPYPDGATPYTATATGTTAATTATLAGASSVTTYLCGFSIRANATAAATGNATVTGVITATLNYTQWTAPLASGIGVVEQVFTPCIPASATNTSIAVVSAAPGSGGVVSVTAWGYKL